MENEKTVEISFEQLCDIQSALRLVEKHMNPFLLRGTLGLIIKSCLRDVSDTVINERLRQIESNKTNTKNHGKRND